MPRRAKIEEFTDAFVRRATPGEYAERKLDGFSLRVTPQGRRRFCLRYVAPDGRQRRLSLFSTELGAAREEAKQARTAGCPDPVAKRRREKALAKARTVRTVADLWADYETHQSTRVRASTLVGAKGFFDRYLRAEWGRLNVEDVTPQHALRLLRALETRGVKTTRNRVKGLIGALWNHAADQLGVPLASPVKGRAFRGPKEAPRHRTLTDDELRALWKTLDHTRQAGVKVSGSISLALMLAAATLQRRGEIAGLDQAELNLPERIWTIPPERTKNKRAHVVPLSPLALALIKRAQIINGGAKPKGPLFPSPRGGAVGAHALTSAMARVCKCKAVKIEGACVHDLRRTGASAMASERLGIERYIVSRCLNHSDAGGGSLVTMQHYTVADDMPRKRRALEAWATLLESIVSEREQTSNVVQMEAARA